MPGAGAWVIAASAAAAYIGRPRLKSLHMAMKTNWILYMLIAGWCVTGGLIYWLTRALGGRPDIAGYELNLWEFIGLIVLGGALALAVMCAWNAISNRR